LIFTYRGYETTAQLRTYDATTGLIHDCPALVIADVIQCACGVIVSRYTDGSKANGDGSPHVCPRRITVKLAPNATPPAATPAPKPPAKPVNPSGHWRGAISTEIKRNPGV